MKQVFAAALAFMLIFSLTACIGSGGDDNMRVKCPACGYEFDAPIDR